MFLLTRDREDCKEPFCSKHGICRAVNPFRRKDLDESDMFMPYIDCLAPVNSLCGECLGKCKLGPQLFTRKSSSEDIREDIRVNDIIVREKHLRKRVIGRIKESEEVQVI